jgi:uncharacterized membrane protein HdeD (DUF308 family)
MYTELTRNWWALALRGVLAIAFGTLALLWPALALLVVVVSFAAYALVDGVFAIMAAVTGQRPGRRWWSLVLEGVLGISAGVLTLLWPGITWLVLLYLMAYWAIATGVFEVVAAVRLRKEIEGEWALALSGILSVLFGLTLVVLPDVATLAVAWLIATYWILFGALLLTLAFRLRTGRYLPTMGAGALR